jgi:hypothetical protein
MNLPMLFFFFQGFGISGLSSTGTPEFSFTAPVRGTNFEAPAR